MGRGELLVENKIGRNDPANSHIGCKLIYMGIIVAFELPFPSQKVLPS